MIEYFCFMGAIALCLLARTKKPIIAIHDMRTDYSDKYCDDIYEYRPGRGAGYQSCMFRLQGLGFRV